VVLGIRVARVVWSVFKSTISQALPAGTRRVVIYIGMWPLLVLLCCLLLLVHSANSVVSTDHFAAYVRRDDIIYTAIKVPQYSSRVEFRFWSLEEGTVILLRYNGVPSLDVYGARIELPSLPSMLSVIDEKPPCYINDP
jgi:hypothetical protein